MYTSALMYMYYNLGYYLSCLLVLCKGKSILII